MDDHMNTRKITNLYYLIYIYIYIYIYLNKLAIIIVLFIKKFNGIDLIRNKF